MFDDGDQFRHHGAQALAFGNLGAGGGQGLGRDGLRPGLALELCGQDPTHPVPWASGCTLADGAPADLVLFDQQSWAQVAELGDLRELFLPTAARAVSSKRTSMTDLHKHSSALSGNVIPKASRWCRTPEDPRAVAPLSMTMI